MPHRVTWSRSILSPSPASSDIDDDDHDDGSPIKEITIIPYDARLARELDLADCGERAVFRETPFTLAKLRGGKKRGGGRCGEEPPKRRGNIHPATTDGKAPLEILGPVKGSKGKVEDPAQEGRAALVRPSQWKSNYWYDIHGKPIPKAPPAPSKRSLIDELDDPQNTAVSRVKKGKKAAPKRKKAGKSAEEDKPVFRMIPADAGPNDRYPIIQGFEKQRSLPVKSRKLVKKKAKPVFVPDSTDEPLPELDINALVGGINCAAKVSDCNERNSSESKRKLSRVSANDDSKLLEDAVTADKTTVLNAQVSRYFRPPAPIRLLVEADNKVADPPEQMSTQIPSLYRSGPTIETDRIDTPAMSARAPSDVSTITHIPSFELQPNLERCDPLSSSQLPYSSPLLIKYKQINESSPVDGPRIFQPRPRRTNPVVRLESLAVHEHPRISTEQLEGDSIKRREFSITREEDTLRSLSQAAAHKPASHGENYPILHNTQSTFVIQSRGYHERTSKRSLGPDEAPSFFKQDRHQDTTMRTDHTSNNHSAIRSPAAEWSTLPPKRCRTNRYQGRSSPKLSDKFIMPIQLFSREAQQRPPPPPIPKFTTKVTLFTPTHPAHLSTMQQSKLVFNVQTNKGSRYGPIVSGREEAPPRQTSSPSPRVHRDHGEIIYNEQFEAAPHYHPQSSQEQQEQEAEPDWTRAYKKLSKPTNGNIHNVTVGIYDKFKLVRANA